MRHLWLWMLPALLWTATPALAVTTGTLQVTVVSAAVDPDDGREVALLEMVDRAATLAP